MTSRTVVLAGAGGLVGSALAVRLAASGWQVVRLVRRELTSANERGWDPARRDLDPAHLEGADAVVNLAGAGLADRRWTRARRRELIASRVDSTRLIANTISGLSHPPRVFASCSAVGIYGDRGDEILDESSSTGSGFLADLAREWEGAAMPAQSSGARVVYPRLGIVLAGTGGALARLLPLARFGLAGPLGSGRQWWSWISLGDATRAILHLLSSEDASGPVNLVAPAPLPQAEFARELGRVMSRPAWLPAPGFALRVVLGDMADEMLLASQRVLPTRLNGSGFTFDAPGLADAMRAAISRRDAGA